MNHQIRRENRGLPTYHQLNIMIDGFGALSAGISGES